MTTQENEQNFTGQTSQQTVNVEVAPVNVEVMPLSPKSRLAALLLCFFFGLLGIHRFYVGKIGTGVIMLILTITLFGIVITGIWEFIDFLYIVMGKFRDKHGRRVGRWVTNH